jgi:hypothetical protein
MAYARALLRPKDASPEDGAGPGRRGLRGVLRLSFATVMVIAPPAVTQHLPSDRLIPARVTGGSTLTNQP